MTPTDSAARRNAQPRSSAPPRKPVIAPYAAGDLTATNTAGENARLTVSLDVVDEGHGNRNWRQWLELETRTGVQRKRVPKDQRVTDVLDDLTSQGWDLLTVVVEESAIVAGSGLSEKSTPVRTAY